jgi:uncharacterized membrane protein YkvA (DUF1232 family)
MNSSAQRSVDRPYGALPGIFPPPALRPPRLRRGLDPLEQRDARETLLRILRDLPNLLRLLYRLGRDPRVSRLDKLLVVSAAVYLAAPNDLIPDWIPVLGQLDDLLLIGVTLHRLFERAGPNLILEHWEGNPCTIEALLGGMERISLVFAPVPLWPRRA